MKEKIQKDLDNGMFYKICSNETTFKEYIFPLIDQAVAEDRERVRGEIEKKLEIINDYPFYNEFVKGEKEAYDNILSSLQDNK